MIIKTYNLYIIKNFLTSLVNVSLIFFALVFILNIFEEISFFKDQTSDILIPILLTFLNIPSVIFDIFPFIFLITTQVFFLNLLDKDELNIFKNFGLNNFKIIKVLALTSFAISILLIVLFYNLSAKLKFKYLDLKNSFANDNKYLAVVTENGLWIKDEINGLSNIVNAEQIEGNFLKKVTITQFSKDFKFIKSINSKSVDITNKNWIIYDASIFKDNLDTKIEKQLVFETNFDLEKINHLFSNLSSMTLFGLKKLKTDYRTLNYSTTEIDLHSQKLYSYPLYLVIMTVLSAIIMLNIKHNNPRLFYLLGGILVSVSIYYINYFFGLLGKNQSLPIIFSAWMPLVLLIIFCLIGLVRINEK